MSFSECLWGSELPLGCFLLADMPVLDLRDYLQVVLTSSRGQCLNDNQAPKTSLLRGWSRDTKAPSAPASDPPEALEILHSAPLAEARKAILNGKHQLLAHPNHRAVHNHLPPFPQRRSASPSWSPRTPSSAARSGLTTYVKLSNALTKITAVATQCMKLLLPSRTKAD